MEVGNEVKNSLKSIGISASVITLLVVIGTGAFLYKNYLEIQLTKLKIQAMKKGKDVE